VRNRRGCRRPTALAALAGVLAWGSARPALAADPEAMGGSAPKSVYHTVEPGETLWTIAERYGTSVARVARENRIENPQLLWVGVRLRIPVASDARVPTPGGPKLERASGVGTPGTAGLGSGRTADVDPRGTVGLDPKRTGAARDLESTGTAALLDRCESELRAARFEQALESARQARKRIDARDDAGDNSNRVRLEIATATAYVALGQSDAALASLERALIANPGLELDPALTSPKVLAVFRAARARATRRP